jgi:hypothetical protein
VLRLNGRPLSGHLPSAELFDEIIADFAARQEPVVPQLVSCGPRTDAIRFQ